MPKLKNMIFLNHVRNITPTVTKIDQLLDNQVTNKTASENCKNTF